MQHLVYNARYRVVCIDVLVLNITVLSSGQHSCMVAQNIPSFFWCNRAWLYFQNKQI